MNYVSLGTGTAVRLSGVWRSSPSGKEQSHELHVEDVQVLGPANPEVSLQISDHYACTRLAGSE